MTGTVVAVVAAVVVFGVAVVGQVMAWRYWQRRARRRAVLEAFSSSGTASDQAGAAHAKASPPGKGGPQAKPTNPLDRAALWLREHRNARRGLTGAAAVMAVAAVGIIAYPLITDLYNHKLQDRLRDQLNSDSLRQDYRHHRVKVGDALVRIKIPSIGVDVVVVEGTTAKALRAGAGHYSQTALPCADGNVGIAGHRTTYGKPFHDLDKVKTGDRITLITPIGQCRYKVSKPPFRVAPSAIQVLDPPAPGQPAGELTLTTCDPPGSAARRLIVQADRPGKKATKQHQRAGRTPSTLGSGDASG